MSAPSSASVLSNWTMRASSCSNPAVLMRRCARSSTGSEYQDLRNKPIRPRGGRSRQNRQYSGRSASSSDGTPNARVRIHRGSIHALSRLTVSPFPAPSTPAKTTMTGNDAPRSCCCSSRSRVRSFGARRLYSSFDTRCPSSAVSNMWSLGTTGYRRVTRNERSRQRLDVSMPPGSAAANRGAGLDLETRLHCT